MRAGRRPGRGADDRPLQRSGRRPLSFRVSSLSGTAFFLGDFWQATVSSVASCLSSHLSFSVAPWSEAETGGPASAAADKVKARTIFVMMVFLWLLTGKT
jgi:hypothetical protein